jgi:hypothetical protein
MISPFEYIIVLISIILGMGITQILSGVAGMILRWEQLKPYWPHMIWVVLLFVFHIQEWWVTYELRTYEYWRLPVFLFVILYPVNLYILARILFPLRWSGQIIDMREFYLQNCRKIFIFILSLSLLSIANNLLISGASWKDQWVQSLVAVIAALVVFFDLRQEWVHKVVVIFLVLTTIIAFIVEWDVLLILNTKP